jgi:uncharacterized membrane protein
VNWYYDGKDEREFLLYQQQKKDREAKEAQQNAEAVTNDWGESSTLESASSVADQATPSADTLFTLNDLLVEIAFWSIVISFICFVIFCCWLLYVFLNKLEKRLEIYFNNRKL